MIVFRRQTPAAEVQSVRVKTVKSLRLHRNLPACNYCTPRGLGFDVGYNLGLPRHDEFGGNTVPPIHHHGNPSTVNSPQD